MVDITALIPRVELPKWFSMTSSGENDTKLVLDARINDEDHRFENTYEGATLTLIDVVELFPNVEKEDIPALVRLAGKHILLPRHFQLSALPAGDKEQEVELRLHLLEPAEPELWSKRFPASRLNLRDLGVLIDWAKKAMKYQR